MSTARRVAAVGIVSFLVGPLACSSPTKPSVTVVSARPVSPTDGTQISYYGQPVTLRVTNGVATGSTQVTDSFEVATDSGFAAKVLTKEVSQGPNGQTSLTLDQLAASKDYYWRVRSSSGDNPGVVSATFKFTIGPLLVIQAPVPVQPPPNSFQHKRPTLSVMNASHIGPAPKLTYRFEVASDPAFTNVVASGTVAEGQSQTSFTPTSDLMSGAMYYWRVRATDTTTGVASGYSTPRGFTTVNPDDGNFRYDLVVHFPATCLAKYTYPPLADYGFDNNLAVSGDTLRFSLPSYTTGLPRLELVIQRTGSQLAGTIGGVSPWRSAVELAVWGTAPANFETFPNPAMLSGNTDNKGRLMGTFDGSAEVLTCCETIPTCVNYSGFAWTLTPHP